MNNNQYDVIILGGGAAGLTAGIYLSRAKVKTLILNEGMVGGQIVLTHEIANYPGVENVSGYMLAMTMKKQAESFGCEIKQNVVINTIELEGDIKKVTVGEETYTAKAVIIATGGRSRELGVAGEDTFKGRGISYCATCDGDFYTDKDIIVVGGGNSALEEAVALTTYARTVKIVHIFDHFQGFEHAIEAAKKNDKISFVLNSSMQGFYGNEKLEKVKIKNLKDNTVTEMPMDGVFILIGYTPNTEKLKGLVSINEKGEIPTDDDMATNVAGVFAVGDVRQKKIRQIATAVSDGAIAAISAIEYIQQ
ncbi:MAG TPA: pyridine nucleotide-disulfide oxidoreductase [Lutibacter sp.]|nr:pyridine nucleotide-disulfide oxidoreductase [Lutibacter sp.]